MELIIYGAQATALGAFEAITSLYPGLKIPRFLVTSAKENPAFLAGLPVTEIFAYSEKLSAAEKKNTKILIATPENVQPEIEEVLESAGFTSYRRLTSLAFSELMKLFHTKLEKFLPLSALPPGFRRPFLRGFVAKSHRDQSLRGNFSLPDWMVPIHTGAVFSDRAVASIRDDTGENISAKNKNYSEITALYWIWKNRLNAGGGDSRQYYGLMQYRRMLWLTGEDILRLADYDIDVVLPYPMPYEPDISAHHRRYLHDADWKTLESAVKKIRPDYSVRMDEVMTQKYFYNYNILLAKKSVLRDYAEWLFPILFEVENTSEPSGNERADRYLGYMAESLLTLYFMVNLEGLTIAHTGCRFFA